MSTQPPEDRQEPAPTEDSSASTSRRGPKEPSAAELARRARHAREAAQVETLLKHATDTEKQILEEELEVPRPFWWARSSLPQRTQALKHTITFTEWVIQVWNLERKLLPPCWVHHPDIVVEMNALAMAHSALYRVDNPAGPVQWLLYLDYQRRRLADNNAAAGCASRGYHDLIDQGPDPVQQRLRSYGEGDERTPELPITVGHWTWPHAHPENQSEAPAPDDPRKVA